MRVLEYADIRDEQPLVVGRKCDPERIPPGRRAADHGREVVGFDDMSLSIDAGDDLRRVDHVHVKAALIDDVQEAAVLRECHVARKRALETLRRRGDDGERSIEWM